MAEHSPTLSTSTIGPAFTIRLAGLDAHASWRTAACLIACVSAVLGFVATSPAASSASAHAAGRDLEMLLRFMAVVKAGFALGLVSAAAWRLGFPARPGIAAAYLVACALMPAGAGLIWGLTHVVIGALLFHSGMILLIATGWVDQDTAGELMMKTIRKRK